MYFYIALGTSLLVLVPQVLCQKPICTQANVDQYLASGNLDAQCVGNLVAAVISPAVVSPTGDAVLAAACTPSCAGRLANWLLRECSAVYNSTYLYTICLRTRGTVGSYCRYSIQPWYDSDGGIEAVFTACSNVTGGTCSNNCASQLQKFANQLGCCYQSIYNNTDYIQESVNIGVVTGGDQFILQLLGDQGFWLLCGVTPPDKCTDESFSFPTGGSVKLSVSHLALAVAVMLVLVVQTLCL